MAQEDPRAEAFADVDYTRRLKKNAGGVIKATLNNTVVTLERDKDWCGILALNTFANRIEKRKAPPYPGGLAGTWTESDDVATACWLDEQRKIEAKTSTVAEAVALVAERNSYHPIRDFLDGLKWDGEHRLSLFFQRYFSASLMQKLRGSLDRYQSIVARRFLISAVARIYEPGCQADQVLILEGVQGAGKSGAVKTLGAPWVSDTSLAIGEKDALASLQGVWIVELPEVEEQFVRRSHGGLKAFVTSRVDRFRPAYGRRTRDFPRQCVFIGTTNHEQYFQDTTGNRRFWPVWVSSVRLDELRRDRDQLWAEAVALYRAGEPWHLQGDEFQVVQENIEARELADPWVEIIGAWLAESTTPAERTASDGAEKITVARVLRQAIGMPAQRINGRGDAMRVGRCLRSLGFVRREAGSKRDRERARHYYVQAEK